MNRSNPECLGCTSYIEKGPRRCKHVFPAYYKFKKNYCPCITCIARVICRKEMREINYRGEKNCNTFRWAINNLIEDKIKNILERRNNV